MTTGAFIESVLGPGDAAGSETTTAQPSAPRLLVTASALHDFVVEMAAALGVRDSLNATGVRVRYRAIPIPD